MITMTLTEQEAGYLIAVLRSVDPLRIHNRPIENKIAQAVAAAAAEQAKKDKPGKP